MSRIRPLLIAALALAAGVRTARAQGEDAIPLAGGTLRIGIAPDWSHWTSRFGSGTPGYPAGTKEPLGVDFSSDSLGVTQLPFLSSVETRLDSVIGGAFGGNFRLNLGRAQLTLSNSYRVIPVSAEWAISNRLGFRVMVPIVRARVDVFLNGPDTSAAHRSRYGINPALLNPALADTFRTQVDTALAALRYQATSGPASLRAQAAAAYQQMQPVLCSLYTLAGGSGASTSACHGRGNPYASPVLPDTASPEGRALDSVLARTEAQYQSLRAQYAGINDTTLPGLTAGYILPAASLVEDSAQHDLQTVLTSPNGPIAGDSLTSMVRTKFGNIELGGWYQLAAGRSWRSQLTFTLRLPTGTNDSPANFIDLGTGTNAMGWEIGVRNDFVLRDDFWLHAGLRVNGWSSSSRPMRVGPVNWLILPIWDTATVRQSLGGGYAIDVVPNWQLDDAFRLSIGAHYSHVGQTHYAYTGAADSARIGMPASVLDGETQASALQLAGGVTFSTVRRYALGEASIPYDITAAFRQTFSGSGGKVPAAAAFYMQIRVYIGATRGR